MYIEGNEVLRQTEMRIVLALKLGVYRSCQRLKFMFMNVSKSSHVNVPAS